MSIKGLLTMTMIIALPAAVALSPLLRQRRSGPDANLWDRIVERFHPFVPYLFLMSLLLLLLRLETSFDLLLTEAMRLDFTPFIHGVEGTLVADLQARFLHPLLSLYFGLIYTLVYAFLYYGILFIYLWNGDEVMVKRLTAGIVITYALAAPFYLFVPVNEVWTTAYQYEPYHYSAIQGVFYGAEQGTEAYQYAINSINNCFPSLHTGFSVLIMLLLYGSRRFKMALWVTPITISVVLATMYLGIHWFLDVVGGVVLAMIVAYLVLHIDYKVRFPMTVTDVRWLRDPREAEGRRPKGAGAEAEA